MSTEAASNVRTIYPGSPELRERIRGVMSADKRMSQTVLAREAGVSSTTLSQWLSGTYAGNNEAIEQKLEIWLESYEARRAAGGSLPAAPAWVETPTGQRIVAGLSYAQIAGDIAVIYGGAGLGKTTACQRYALTSPSVWVATMTPASASVVTCLEEVCEAVGAGDAGGGAAKLFRAIVKRVRDTHGLLVIDEAQHLSVAALDQLRSLHDATGIGIALVGNEAVYARMTGGNRAAYLDRLFSRIGKRLGLRQSTEADITALLGAWGIDDGKCRGQLIEIARKPGALRTLTKTLRLASSYAAAESRGVCCEDVRAAARELGSVA